MLKAAWIQAILTVLTTVPGIVAKVEASDPNLPGEGKKMKVLAEIKTALVEADPLVGQFLADQPEILAGFEVAVDTAVDLYNRSAKILQDKAVEVGAPVPSASLIAGTTTTAAAQTNAGQSAGLSTGAPVPPVKPAPTGIPPAVAPAGGTRIG